MKKISLFLSIVCISLFIAHASPVQAETLRDARNDLRDAKNNLMGERKDFREDLREKIATKVGAIKSKFTARAAIRSGKLTQVNGTSLTVEKDGKSYTVLTGVFEKCTTKFRRRYWGSSSIAEYAVGDTLNVLGRYQNDEKTIIEACVVRNVSIQKRKGVFVGKIISLNASGWTMSTVGEKRPDQSVAVSASTKYVNRKGESITQSDIKVGDRVRIKGLWNRVNNTVTEVTHVKNYNLPVRAVSPTPTP